MDVLVERVLRKGKKTARVLLSSGETAIVDIKDLPEEGSVFSTMTSSDNKNTLRPLSPEDPYPSLLRF